MILKDNLYVVQSVEHTDKGPVFQLELNPAHFIYQAHFPNHPITPGVCIVQIVKELLEAATEKQLTITKVNNVKFLSVISPVESQHITCHLTKIQPDETEGSVKAQAVLYSEKENFAKVSVICKEL